MDFPRQITSRQAAVVLGILLLLIVGVFMTRGDKEQAAYQPPPVEKVAYKVKKNEFIISIANANKVSWQTIMLENEERLVAEAAKICGRLSEKYRNRTSGGYYCRESLTFEGKSIVHANSLQPGFMLYWPKSPAPAMVTQLVAAIEGKRIVVVIDDTESMADDRNEVANWYFQSITGQGKTIVAAIVYADNEIRELKQGSLQLETTGGWENTRGALEAAAEYGPDAIVLISDEPGDDWNGFKDLVLPSVIAHSLDPSADGNLRKVAKLTGGTFTNGTEIIARR